MSSPTNIEYDSDQTSAMTSFLKNNKRDSFGQGGIIGFLVGKGIVKNEKNATYLLLGISATFILLTGYFFYQALKAPTVNPIVGNHNIK